MLTTVGPGCLGVPLALLPTAQMFAFSSAAEPPACARPWLCVLGLSPSAAWGVGLSEVCHSARFHPRPSSRVRDPAQHPVRRPKLIALDSWIACIRCSGGCPASEFHMFSTMPVKASTVLTRLTLTCGTGITGSGVSCMSLSKRSPNLAVSVSVRRIFI